MKTLRRLLNVAVLLFAVACSDGEVMELQNPVSDNQTHVYKACVNAELDGYEGKTKAETQNWSDGDRLYLIFNVSGSSLSGEALYSDGTWSVSVFGNLVAGTSSSVKVYYIENASSRNGSVFQMTHRSAIYQELSGTYQYDGELLSLVAQLKPMFGRIRFAGTRNTAVILSGISYPVSFNASNGTVSTSFVCFKDTVRTTGYTDYIYGTMTDADDPRLYVITRSSAFTKYCNSQVLSAGTSGWLSIPAPGDCFGWNNCLALKVNGVEMKMRPLTCTDTEKGTDYLLLMGETEVTEGFYNAVSGSGSKTSKYPKVNISFADARTFAQTSMVNKTGLTAFNLPTVSQWQSAFGQYTYSGSNSCDEVAWYKNNSDGSMHQVAGLMPNEYGLFDMSGNVSEWVRYTDTSDYYYYSFYDHYYYYGGDYSSESCYKTTYSYYTDSSSSSSFIGFRLAMRFF